MLEQGLGAFEVGLVIEGACLVHKQGAFGEVAVCKGLQVLEYFEVVGFDVEFHRLY